MRHSVVGEARSEPWIYGFHALVCWPTLRDHFSLFSCRAFKEIAQTRSASCDAPTFGPAGPDEEI